MCTTANLTIAADALQWEAAAAERAALEKAHAEQLNRASLAELLRAAAHVYWEHG
jgi:hypothetical protein